MQRASFDEVCAQHGLAEAKTAQIKSAIELGRRMTLGSPEERSNVNCPAHAACLVQYVISALEQAELRVILLITCSRIQKIETIYRGSLNTSQVRVAEVFGQSFLENAPAIQQCYIAITRCIKDTGDLLDIQILDQQVIGHGRFVSLKERGLGFE